MDSRVSERGAAALRFLLVLMTSTLVVACHVGDLLTDPSTPPDGAGTPGGPPPPPPGSAQIALNGGNGQRDTVAATLAPYSVRVTDPSARPVAGVRVEWRALDGGAVVPSASFTDASGIARATQTLGTTPGTQRVQAAAFGYAGSPRTFTSIADHAAVHTLTYEVDASDVDMGEAMSPAPRVVLRDRFGNLADGVSGNASVQLVSGTGTPLAELAGDRIVPITSGRALFSDLRVTLAGQGYRVLVLGAGREAESQPFDVTLVSLLRDQ